MCLEHRCEGSLPNGQAEELITRQIMKALHATLRGLDLIFKVSGNHLSSIVQTLYE